MGGSHSSFNPDRDIPSLSDKVIFITGGNSGLGKQTILELSKHNPKQIWMTARSEKKAVDTIAEIKQQVPSAGDKIRYLELDTASLSSVSAAAHAFRQQSDQLDVLILNAGIMSVPEGTTKDGYEIQFGTNHMGHALLTKLLLPTLLKTAEMPGADARVVVLSSAAHGMAPSDKGIKFETLKGLGNSINSGTRYGQSKLCNLLYARALAKHYPQITAVSVHPGIVRTNLGETMGNNSMFMRVAWAIASYTVGVDIVTGTLNSLWAATAKGIKSGEYYVPVGKAGKGQKFSSDDKLAEQLWNYTEKELENWN